MKPGQKVLVNSMLHKGWRLPELVTIQCIDNPPMRTRYRFTDTNGCDWYADEIISLYPSNLEIEYYEAR